MFSFFKRNKVVVRHRPDHCISRKLISREALKVLYRLSDSGYKAYLVGGGVRDILLGREPKDFDVATDALPREIKRLFSRSFIIGKRFRLVHVVFGDTVIETSTFRRQPPAGGEVPDGELYQSDDNTFGTPEEDAKRRDFTVNGLFYDIKTFDIIDYVGGLRDLDKRVLRSIGDPDTRFREDPVRMMRAIRLACKLGLKIEGRTRRAISRNYREIEKASIPRVLEELFRMFPFSASAESFRLLWETRLLSLLMPHLSEFIDGDGGRKSKVWNCLAEFDGYTAKTGADPSNGLRIAVIYLAPYLAALAADSGKRRPNRLRRMELADGAIRTMDEKYRFPRVVLQHATRLLAGLADFTEGPQRGKVVKDRDGQFSDALVIARIAARVFGIFPEKMVDAWSKVKRIEVSGGRQRGGVDEPAAEAAPEKHSDAARPDAVAGADGEAVTDADAAESDSGTQDGERHERRRSRRRGRRSGRGRGHRGHGGAVASQPGAEGESEA